MAKGLPIKFANAVLAVLLFSAGKVSAADAEPSIPVTNGVLCLTFDDRNFQGWLGVREMFRKYDAHATFFVCGAIDGAAVAAIRALQADGHAVGLHSLRHTKVTESLKTQSQQSYLEEQIIPQKTACDAAGIRFSSFAYPMSTRDAGTDAMLSRYFKRLRVGRFDRDNRAFRDVPGFFTPVETFRSRLLHDGFSIGSSSSFNLGVHLEMVDDLARLNRCATFYTHNIATTANDHDISPVALEAILKRAKERGVRVLSFDDLDRVTCVFSGS